MIINPHVPLHRLVLSLSEGLDYVSPTVADHQLKVAYMATQVARNMGIGGTELSNIFHAAALHDIGLLRTENRIRAVEANELEGLDWHSETGYELLKDNTFFAAAAPIVRYHHTFWNYGQGEQVDGQQVPLASHIILLCDTVDRLIDRSAPILTQCTDIINRIIDGSESEFHPDCVEAFKEVSSVPAFWLDVTSKRLYSILDSMCDWAELTIDEFSMGGIAHIFAQVVDALSPWTACHSSGVSAVAEELCKKLNFSPREQALMRTAGYLHDLGKITVPSSILEKNGKLTPEEWAVMKGHTYHTFRILDSIGGMPQVNEWASFHHERLDGRGYPFGHSAKDLTLGSRIMAVADITTALTENRPYRHGMSVNESITVLNGMAAKGAVDGDIVAILTNNFEEIDQVRIQKSNEYTLTQKRLSDIVACSTDSYYTIS